MLRCGAAPCSGAGCAGVQGGLAGGGQAVHPPLGRGPGVLAAQWGAERVHRGLDDLQRQGVPARTGDRPGVLHGEPERQVPALEPFPFPALNGIGIRAVDQILPQDTQLGGVQARRWP